MVSSTKTKQRPPSYIYLSIPSVRVRAGNNFRVCKASREPSPATSGEGTKTPTMAPSSYAPGFSKECGCGETCPDLLLPDF
jgi:hypothetical protein